jgi:phospholipase/carboxylesterase
VYVGGFSQGAVAALHYALSTKQLPAGVISASGYLLKHTILANLGKLPALLMHGKQDKTILEGEAKSSYAQLTESSELIEYQSYPDLGHTLTIQQLIAIRKWLEHSYSFIS